MISSVVESAPATEFAASAPRNLPAEVDRAMLEEILRPYRKNATYLKSAAVLRWLGKTPSRQDKEQDLIVGRGTFEIPESCYIDDTGHFNAVEFNICYNQLAYVLFGKCIQQGILQPLIPDWDAKVNLTYADFLRRQLSSMLIVRIEGKFTRQIKSDELRGELAIQRIVSKGGAYFVSTTITFSDFEGVKSKGAVMLAFSPGSHS